MDCFAQTEINSDSSSSETKYELAEIEPFLGILLRAALESRRGVGADMQGQLTGATTDTSPSVPCAHLGGGAGGFFYCWRRFRSAKLGF